MTTTYTPVDDFQQGIKNLQILLTQMSDTYHDLIAHAASSTHDGSVLRIEHPEMLNRALTLFGPQIELSGNQLPPHRLYGLGIHLKTGAIIVAGLPSTFPSTTPVFSRPFVTHYQTFSVYMPGLGVEVATVGRIGEVRSKPYVLRSESACTPSFLFGSQHCNCASQWRCTQELAAWFNAKENADSDKPGFLMIHLENQNGMGMGYSENTFAIDLGTRAHLRHGAALYAGQTFNLTLKETFAALGLAPDPRQAAGQAGYRITPILLDYLETHRDLILLSNNPHKRHAIQAAGYSPLRLKLQGEITSIGQTEARARQTELGHLDIGDELSSFNAEFSRLKQQITMTYQERRKQYAG